MSPRARILVGVALLLVAAAALVAWGERGLRPRVAETRAALVGPWDVAPRYGAAPSSGEPCRIEITTDADGDLKAVVWRLRGDVPEQAETLPLVPAPFETRSFEGGPWRITLEGPDAIAVYPRRGRSVFEGVAAELTGTRTGGSRPVRGDTEEDVR